MAAGCIVRLKGSSILNDGSLGGLGFLQLDITPFLEPLNLMVAQKNTWLQNRKPLRRATRKVYSKLRLAKPKVRKITAFWVLLGVFGTLFYVL